MASGAYLVIKGQIAAPPIDPNLRRELAGLNVSMDQTSFDSARETFKSLARALITATALNLPHHNDRQYALVGETGYLTEPGRSEPIYSVGMVAMGGRASVSNSLDTANAERIARQAAKLVEDGGLERSSRLLSLSHDQKTDELQAFLAAWSALEIFVQKSFSAQYEGQWFDLLEGAAPPAAGPVFERLRAVKRDALLHGEEVEAPYPTEAIQALLQTYMRLHLDV